MDSSARPAGRWATHAETRGVTQRFNLRFLGQVPDGLRRSGVEGFQLPAHDLAGGGLGQVGNERDGAGHHVGAARLRALVRALLGQGQGGRRPPAASRQLARRPAASLRGYRVRHVARYIAIVRCNQLLLHAQVRALPWRQVPRKGRARDSGHSRPHHSR